MLADWLVRAVAKLEMERRVAVIRANFIRYVYWIAAIKIAHLFEKE
jgi:hypothetical protein